MRIRFHLDEHISGHVAAGLRRRNIDTTTAADAGMTGSSDLAHIEYANSGGRVVVTQDDDFLRLHADGVPHAGIAYCQQNSMPVGEMLPAGVDLRSIIGGRNDRKSRVLVTHRGQQFK